MARINYKIKPWKAELDENDNRIKVGTVYIHVVKGSKSDTPHIAYKVRTPGGIVKGEISASESKIPLETLTASNQTMINIEQDIASNDAYVENILLVTASRGHTLGKHNRKWMFPTFVATLFGGALGFISVYIAPYLTLAAAEFFASLPALALTTLLSASSGALIGLVLAIAGTCLLFNGKDSKDNTQIFAGAVLSVIGWGGLGASVGAILGTVLLAATGPAFLAILGCAVGVGIALLFTLTAITITHCCNNRWQKMIDTAIMLPDHELELSEQKGLKANLDSNGPKSEVIKRPKKGANFFSSEVTDPSTPVDATRSDGYNDPKTNLFHDIHLRDQSFVPGGP